MLTPITDWGAAFMTSMAAALALLLGGIPKVIGFLLILIVGWIIAGIVGRAVTRLLRAVDFERLAERTGLRGFVRQTGVTMTPSAVVGAFAKWLIRLVAIVVAFDTLGLPAVSQALQSLLLWLPNLVVAIAVLVLAGLAASALSRIVRGATAEAGFTNPDLLATVTAAAVWGFGIVIAINQIGVATNLVTILFAGLVATLALAFGLAFGIGGRETAARILSDWYGQSRAMAPRVGRAMDAARAEASDSTRHMEEMERTGDGDLVPPAERRRT